jgi:hypothetical protein
MNFVINAEELYMVCKEFFYRDEMAINSYIRSA